MPFFKLLRFFMLPKKYRIVSKDKQNIFLITLFSIVNYVSDIFSENYDVLKSKFK